jgi:hypothetical protein
MALRALKAGASEPRQILGEAAWKVTLTPGPLRAFFERVRVRRTLAAESAAAAAQCDEGPRRCLWSC